MNQTKIAIEKNVPVSIFNKLKNDDRDAFKQLFDIYYQHLVLFATRYVGDQDMAENIVQEVFVNLWEKRKKLQVYSVQSYLVVAVRNRCQNEIKRQKNLRLFQMAFKSDTFQPPADFPDDFFMNKIMAVINAMPEKRKRIFKMNRLDGMKYKEIALALQLSPKTVEIQIGKALKYLRENLSEIKNKVYHEN